MDNTDPRDLALAQIRVALDDIAPEINDDEIVPDARLVDDLGLDEVSVWALVTNVEMISKKHVADSAIHALSSVEDLMVLIMDEPAASQEDDAQDLASAAADLASLFNR